MERGQVTIEIILIFGMFLLLIFAVSIPTVLQSGRDADDVQYVSDVKFATERLATFAASVSHPDEKKNVEIYMPGSYVGNFSDPSTPATLRAMCIDADGRSLDAIAAIIRQGSEGFIVQEDDYEFSKNLGAGDWKIYVNTGSGYQEGALYEYGGKRYNLIISWENITSNTVPSYVISSCDDAGNEFGGGS